LDSSDRLELDVHLQHYVPIVLVTATWYKFKGRKGNGRMSQGPRKASWNSRVALTVWLNCGQGSYSTQALLSHNHMNNAAVRSRYFDG